MILGAALLVLVALALFVGGIVTGATALYWSCVAVSAVAAVLLVLARRQVAGTRAAGARGDEAPSRAAAGGSAAAGRVPEARSPEARSPEARSRGARSPQATSAERTAPPPVPPPARRVVPEQPDGEPAVAERDDVAPGRAGGATSATSVTDGTAARPPAHSTVERQDDEPPVEEVEVTDLLLVMDLTDEVVVVDEHPRYHLADCPWLRGRTPIPLPLDEARTDGFTPCGICAPDRHLAALERKRRPGRGAS